MGTNEGSDSTSSTKELKLTTESNKWYSPSERASASSDPSNQKRNKPEIFLLAEPFLQGFTAYIYFRFVLFSFFRTVVKQLIASTSEVNRRKVIKSLKSANSYRYFSVIASVLRQIRIPSI